MSDTDRYKLIYFMKRREGGSGYHAIFLAQTYPEIFQSICDNEVDNLDIEDNKIWMLHNPFFYKRCKLCLRSNDLSFVRKDFSKCIPGKHLTNGFSYFKRHSGCFDAWMPTIYQSSFGVNCDQISIGYYIRDARIESNLAFIDFLSKIPSGIPVITMGQKEVLEKHLRKIRSWKHTYDHQIFWKSCSHYFYFRPSDIEDPLPHTLLEAIQSSHRIISPKNPRREFHDGIDDLLSCIEKYDTTLVEELGFHTSCFDKKLWFPYFKLLCQTRFQIAQRSEVFAKKDFSSWIDKNLRG